MFDIFRCCQSNIKCSMTIDQFFASLEAQGMVMDSISGFPLDTDQVSSPGAIYQKVVCANITIIFKSSTTDVRDLEINWPFLINFNSYADTGVFSQTTNVNTSNEYPHIWELPKYLLPQVSSFSGNNRSDKFLTHDIVSFAGTVVVKTPPITRYNAWILSNLSQ